MEKNVSRLRGDENTRGTYCRQVPKRDSSTDPDSGGFGTQVTDEASGKSAITGRRCARLRTKPQGTPAPWAERRAGHMGKGAEERRKVWSRNREADNQEANVVKNNT